jgi:hypothetical protein
VALFDEGALLQWRGEGDALALTTAAAADGWHRPTTERSTSSCSQRSVGNRRSACFKASRVVRGYATGTDIGELPMGEFLYEQHASAGVEYVLKRADPGSRIQLTTDRTPQTNFVSTVDKHWTQSSPISLTII